jgi:hypothetical protein
MLPPCPQRSPRDREIAHHLARRDRLFPLRRSSPWRMVSSSLLLQWDTSGVGRRTACARRFVWASSVSSWSYRASSEVRSRPRSTGMTTSTTSCTSSRRTPSSATRSTGTRFEPRSRRPLRRTTSGPRRNASRSFGGCSSFSKCTATFTPGWSCPESWKRTRPRGPTGARRTPRART